MALMCTWGRLMVIFDGIIGAGAGLPMVACHGLSHGRRLKYARWKNEKDMHDRLVLAAPDLLVAGAGMEWKDLFMGWYGGRRK